MKNWRMAPPATPSVGVVPAALRRAAALVPLDDRAIRLLGVAIHRPVRVKPRAELTTEGKDIREPRMIVDGWAARVRYLVDGRRQFMSFLLPGDLIGACRQPRPLAVSTIVALTDVAVCTPPPEDASASLADAYAVSAALEEAYLLAHITRLGRLEARERIVDLLLELDERLSLTGLAAGGRFQVPLTQEMLADALGLTSVHVNRMLQQLRRAGDLDWRGGTVSLHNPAMLASSIGRNPIQVSALSSPS